MQPLLSDLADLRRHGRIGFPTKVIINLYPDHVEIIKKKTNQVIYNIALPELTEAKPAKGGLLLIKTDKINKISLDFNSVARSLVQGPLVTLFTNNDKAKGWADAIAQNNH